MNKILFSCLRVGVACFFGKLQQANVIVATMTSHSVVMVMQCCCGGDDVIIFTSGAH